MLIGVYEADVFGEAGRSPEGFITVDFLTGTSKGVTPSPSFARAIALYSESLIDLCRKHEASSSAFQQLAARYSVDFPTAVVSSSPSRIMPDDGRLMNISGYPVGAFEYLIRWVGSGPSSSR